MRDLAGVRVANVVRTIVTVVEWNGVARRRITTLRRNAVVRRGRAFPAHADVNGAQVVVDARRFHAAKVDAAETQTATLRAGHRAPSPP